MIWLSCKDKASAICNSSSSFFLSTSVISLFEGRAGRVPFRMQLVIRCDYGSIVPWVPTCSREGRPSA